MPSLLGMRKSFNRSAKWILGVVTAAMLVTAFTGIGATLVNNTRMGAGKGPADPVIATVNGSPITQSEFDQGLNQARRQMAMFGQPQSAMAIGGEHAQVLNQLISEKLLQQVAEQSGVSISSADIDAYRQTQILPEIRRSLGLPATATEQQIDDQLQNLNSPSIEDQFTDDKLRPEVTITKYQQNIARATHVGDQDVQNFYHQVHIRHILIGNANHTDVQAQALAASVLQKLKGGADFTKLAAQYSEDPAVKFNKGDDGWVSQMQPSDNGTEFNKAAMSLSPGQITPVPIKAPNGYFIIQAIGARDNLPKDFAKNKQQYAQQVQQFLENQQMQTALTAAQNKAKITVLNPQYRADREFMSAQTAPDASDPVKRNADMAASLADYQKALPKASFSSAGEIHIQMAELYQMLNQQDKEITELAAAVQSSGDPQLNMTLGSLYRQKGDTKDALAQFKLADQEAYDDRNVHAMLQSLYTQMHQPALAAQEVEWIATYNKTQKQVMAPAGAPGATAIPGAAGKSLVLQPQPAKKAH